MTRHQAGKLQDRMEVLREDPALLLPECRHEGRCFRSGVEKKLRRVAKHADSKLRLRRLARRGPNLSRAFAGALDVRHGDAPDAFLSIKNPFGGAEVKFAARGNARRETQAGVQNYTDPGLRLLAFRDFAEGMRGSYLFTTADGFFCTGREPKPPQEWFAERAAQVRPPLSKEGDDFVCPHLRGGLDAAPRDRDETHLTVKWAQATSASRLCRTCVSDANLTLEARKYAIGPKLNDQIEVLVELRPKCAEKGPKCHFEGRVDLPEEARTSFLAGKHTDAEAIEKGLAHAREDIEGKSGGYVLAGGECLGNDVGSIIERLGAEDEVAKAVGAALKDADKDIVIDALTSSKLLAKFMEDRGEEILEAACGDGQVAKRVFKEAKANEAPATLIARAAKLARHEAIESELPALEGMADAPAVADRAARAYRRGGEDAALREIDSGRTKGPGPASVSWALLCALDKARGREWQFSKIEVERGQHAKDKAKRLLSCTGKDYADALAAFMSAVGEPAQFAVKTT